MRLSAEGKVEAATISKTLNFVKDNLYQHSVTELETLAIDKLKENLKLITLKSQMDTLQDISNAKETDRIVACVAVFLEIRLIDNLVLKG